MEEAFRRATEVRERLTGITGIGMVNANGAEFDRFLDRQITTWAWVIGENNIRPD